MFEKKKSVNWGAVTVRPIAVAADDGQSPLPDHLMRLPGEHWAMWRCAGLRGAGFPAADVLLLAAPDAAPAADRLLRAEDEARSAREAALAAVNSALDGLRANSTWDDRTLRDPL